MKLLVICASSLWQVKDSTSDYTKSTLPRQDLPSTLTHHLCHNRSFCWMYGMHVSHGDQHFLKTLALALTCREHTRPTAASATRAKWIAASTATSTESGKASLLLQVHCRVLTKSQMHIHRSSCFRQFRKRRGKLAAAACTIFQNGDDIGHDNRRFLVYHRLHNDGVFVGTTNSKHTVVFRGLPVRIDHHSARRTNRRTKMRTKKEGGNGYHP